MNGGEAHRRGLGSAVSHDPGTALADDAAVVALVSLGQLTKSEVRQVVDNVF